MRRLSQEEWIQRASKVHNNKYDYSKVFYKSGTKKVVIICKDHGVFEQKASNHLFLKRGCPKCSSAVLLSIDEWISKSIKFHGTFYDYSKSIFTGVKNKINIICPIHGEFSQIAEKHFTGGCRSCAKNKPIDLDSFLKRAYIAHGKYYDYSMIAKCNGKDSKVKIICPQHGLFTQTINNHLLGKGCKHCAVGNSSKKEQLWLDQCQVPKSSRNINIFINNKKFCVDGFLEKEKIIYEFLGDFWHGHPKKFNPNKIHPFIKKPFKDIFLSTILKIRFLRSNGYKVICIWESSFDKQQRKLKNVKDTSYRRVAV